MIHCANCWLQELYIMWHYQHLQETLHQNRKGTPRELTYNSTSSTYIILSLTCREVWLPWWFHNTTCCTMYGGRYNLLCACAIQCGRRLFIEWARAPPIKVEVKVTLNAAGRNCEDGWGRSSDWRHRPRHLQFTLPGESLASSFSSYTAMMEPLAPWLLLTASEESGVPTNLLIHTWCTTHITHTHTQPPKL